METESDSLYEYVHIVCLVESPCLKHYKRVLFPESRTQKNPGLQGIDTCIFHLYLQSNNIFGRCDNQQRKKKRGLVCLYCTYCIINCVFVFWFFFTFPPSVNYEYPEGKVSSLISLFPKIQQSSCQKYIKRGTWVSESVR